MVNINCETVGCVIKIFLHYHACTFVRSRYFVRTRACVYVREKYSRLSLSRSQRDYLKHFEISVPRNIRVAEIRKTIHRTTAFNKWICNLTPEGRDILKILWKRGAISPLFHNILLPVLRFPC